MIKKQQVLDTIRNLCPELAFTSVCRISEKNPKGVRTNYKKIQLNHLMQVLGDLGYIETLYLPVTKYFVIQERHNGDYKKSIKLDSKLSVEKNLDNPELLDLIYELICKK